MLQNFVGQYFIKSLCRAVFICIAIVALSLKSHAQSFGDPIVNITFGSGGSQYGGPLPADSGSTSYTYVNESPQDNFYTIASSTLGMNTGWVFTTDHTGGGYMMVVNASYTPGLFYTRTVQGLCGSTTYQFSAWIKNILIGPGGIKPNVTFTIETPSGQLLGTGNTGDIETTNTWNQYPFTFTTPANTQNIVLKIANNAPGGGGNDIAIDDITFRPSGSLISVDFDQTSANATYCSADPKTVTIHTTSPPEADHYQKLQQYQDGVWIDMGQGSAATSFSFLSPSVPGYHSYRLVSGFSGNINTSNCVVSSNQLNITVFPSPVTDFVVAANTCQGDSTAFKDTTQIADGGIIASRLWDFGDGQTSTKQNPSHLYTTSGDHKVTLTVTALTGCATSKTKTIHVIPNATGTFTVSTPICETRPVTLTDGVKAVEGNILTHVWAMGNGDTIKRTDNLPFEYTYPVAGNYTVNLIVTTDQGCKTTISKQITVAPLPIVDFVLPATCTEDFSKFINNSTVANGTALTYLWNFGDDNSTPANANTSTLKEPVHRFIVAKEYKISLTVSSRDNCPVTLTKDFMVNGATPFADFSVVDPQTLCSNREVFFKNNATANIGKATKVKIYFDAAGDTTLQMTDTDPYVGKLYRYKYPEFHLPEGAKTYKVSMIAYSGGRCPSAPFDVDITVLPTPDVTFVAPDSVCLNSGTLQFEAKDVTGIAGDGGVYSGTGVSSSGLFDPMTAGLGTFTIKYIYTANSGCADTLTHNITVKPLPTVNAGPDATILAGGSTTLHATSTGDNVTYSWFPTTGLSNSTSAEPVVTLDNDVTYTLTATNSYGCSVTDEVKVKVLQLPLIPNAFTPNGDGINDTWEVKYLDSYAGCLVDVFNRYGQKVYTSIGYSTPWNGRFSNGELPAGVYYYIIDPKHGRKLMSGYVTIIR